MLEDAGKIDSSDLLPMPSGMHLVALKIATNFVITYFGIFFSFGWFKWPYSAYIFPFFLLLDGIRFLQRPKLRLMRGFERIGRRKAVLKISRMTSQDQSAPGYWYIIIIIMLFYFASGRFIGNNKQMCLSYGSISKIFYSNWFMCDGCPVYKPAIYYFILLLFVQFYYTLLSACKPKQRSLYAQLYSAVMGKDVVSNFQLYFIMIGINYIFITNNFFAKIFPFFLWNNYGLHAIEFLFGKTFAYLAFSAILPRLAGMADLISVLIRDNAYYSYQIGLKSASLQRPKRSASNGF